MRGLLVVLSAKNNICCVPDSTNTPFVPLNSQRMKISFNIKHIFADEKTYELEGRKFEKLLFNFYFLNCDILLNNTFSNTKSSIHIDNIHMEGTVSQIFYICLSFCFMKCRKFIQKISAKSSRFLS